MSEPAENMTETMNSVPETTEAPAVAAAPEPSDWRTMLPDDLRDNPTIRDTPDVATLAKRVIDLRSQQGNSIRIPGPDASQEDWQAFHQKLVDKNIGLTKIPQADDIDGLNNLYTQLGRPKDASEYIRPEKWEGMNDERFGALRSLAHEVGLSKRQFEQMVTKVAAMDNEYVGNYYQQRQAEIGELKGEWGRAFDQKVARATKLAQQLEAPAPLQEALAAGDVDAATLRWMDSLAEKLSGEGNNSLVSDRGAVSEHTPTEIKEQMNEITRRMLNMSPTDPDYRILMDKRLKLAEMLHS